MGRKNFMVMTFSEIALAQFGMMKENYQQLEMLDQMCGEACELKQEISSHYVAVITFAAMSLEAFLNDYAAQNMGDSFFYNNFEMLRPFSKLQLISKIMFNSVVDTGGIIHELVTKLTRERNQLVHCKSQNFVGMSVEEYNEYCQFLETDENADVWMKTEMARLDIDEEKELFKMAHDALRALKEVASFIDEHDDQAYATAKLLYSGWFVDSSARKYTLIKLTQQSLGVRPLMFSE